MAATGTIELDGKELRWESPSIGDLEHFEAHIGPLTDPKIINSVKGRVELAYLALKAGGSKISMGELLKLPNEDMIPLWNMVFEAVPFLRRFFTIVEDGGSDEESKRQRSGESTSEESSPTAPGSSAGDHPKPDESA